MNLNRGAKVNHLRPSADPLFASAARTLAAKVLGVALSGNDGDGAAGLAMIKRHGGTALVQHPDTAQSPSMPLSAMMLDHPNEFLLVVEMGERVRSFCSTDDVSKRAALPPEQPRAALSSASAIAAFLHLMRHWKLDPVRGWRMLVGWVADA